MMTPMLNAMRLQAQLAGQRRVTKRMGIVSSYDPENYCAKVMLQPGDFETGWLPVFTPWVGNGWGMFCPPSIGDVVDVNFQEDDIDAGYVTLRSFNDSARPLSVPSAEFWLVHKSGSALKFHNDGTVEVTAAATMTYTAAQHHFVGPVQMDNTLNVTQNVTGGANITAALDIADQGGTKTMAGMRTTYNSHTHVENNVPGGNTNTPNGTM